MEITNCLQSADSFKKGRRYVEAAKRLKQVEKLLDDPKTDLESLEIFRALKNEYGTTYATFLNDLSILWQDYVNWEILETEDQHSIVNLRIKCDTEEMQNLVEALRQVESLSNDLNKFSGKLMRHFIGPIIKTDCKVFVTDETIFSVERLNIEDKKPSYKSVLYNLKLLFQFMNQHFNVVFEDGERFFKKFEKHLFKQFSECLINECISKTIPSSSAELENFEPVIQDITEFQNYLVDIGKVLKSFWGKRKKNKRL